MLNMLFNLASDDFMFLPSIICNLEASLVHLLNASDYSVLDEIKKGNCI